MKGGSGAGAAPSAGRAPGRGTARLVPPTVATFVALYVDDYIQARRADDGKGAFCVRPCPGLKPQSSLPRPLIAVGWPRLPGVEQPWARTRKYGRSPRPRPDL